MTVLKERHIPHRLTAPSVFGNTRSEAEVRATYRKSQRFLNLSAESLNEAASVGGPPTAEALQHRHTLVRDVLTELGHTPRDDDLVRGD